VRALTCLVAALALWAAPAVAVRPTDIARVDEYIDAPRALFGRTRAEVERRLGSPAQTRARGRARSSRIRASRSPCRRPRAWPAWF
jgi:hypothetical protein